MWNHLPINKLLPQFLMTKKERFPLSNGSNESWYLKIWILFRNFIWYDLIQNVSTSFHQGWPKIKCSIEQNCCLLTGCFGQLVIWFLVILDKMMLAFKSYFSVTQPHTKCSVCNKIKFWDQKFIFWIKWEMEQSQFIVAKFYLLFSYLISRKQKYTHRKMSQLQND